MQGIIEERRAIIGYEGINNGARLIARYADNR